MEPLEEMRQGLWFVDYVQNDQDLSHECASVAVIDWTPITE